ncbi:maintenance of telomere capping protein 1 [Naematelia encephala]|uniref:Maintenance of telomere capping protein 1 n=1 Tax=Naematelia encephala TaxID=71784 RepID=A0A1Y2AUS7_9TREE|nr:maintenance of telomere capping protein 1 [Naematelia encephala]
MPPKGKKTKAEEALDFLSNLDNLDAPPPAVPETSASPAPAIPTSSSTPRASTDSIRPLMKPATPAPAEEETAEAAKALAYLEAQINTKRAPLTRTASSVHPPPPPTATTTGGGSQGELPTNIPSQTQEEQSGGGWGSSWWSTATSAIQSAQKIADEGYKRVQAGGGVTGGLEQLGVKGVSVDLGKLRQGAGERLGGIVKGVDLEKLRQGLLNNASTTLATILDTVAPPISAHETLELWLSHPMIGYGGVEGVVYRAWTRILEQTESGEMVVVWSPDDDEADEDVARSIRPVEGWEEGWSFSQAALEAIRVREEKDPKGRGSANANLPVTTVPIFLHLQPLLAPLPFPEPQILLGAAHPAPENPPQHLFFLIHLQDPSHALRFTSITQPCPSDWLDVEYDRSDWVEERLVEVLRTGVEIVAQDYVATRMGLKPSTGMTRPASPDKKSQDDKQDQLENEEDSQVQAQDQDQVAVGAEAVKATE